MSMVASVVTYSVLPEHVEELTRRVEQHLIPAAREVSGYRGFLLLDQGEQRRMAILLFDSADAARAAQQALSPVGSEHTYALMASPAIGSLATVLLSDWPGAPA